MSNTKLISIRMPIDVLTEIDRQAEDQGRSRASVIIRHLEGLKFMRGLEQLSPAPYQPQVAGTNLLQRFIQSNPHAPQWPGKPEQLHPVQTVRSELVASGGGGHNERPSPEPHKDHRTYKAGEQRYCQDCAEFY